MENVPCLDKSVTVISSNDVRKADMDFMQDLSGEPWVNRNYIQPGLLGADGKPMITNMRCCIVAGDIHNGVHVMRVAEAVPEAH